MHIDTTFDFRSDSRGKDPDICSPTLRRYHQLLWSKPLPDGTVFTLEDLRSHGYLRHRSERGEFRMSSDTVLRTFSIHKRMQHIITQVPEVEREDVLRRGYTIGGMILFPGVKVGGKHTINQARGINAKLEDRFDLTLECIRRHYAGESSPLAPALARYAAFFRLFGDFRGYVDFFLLKDLIADDYSAVRFWAPFDDFTSSPLPANIDAYRRYRTEMIGWIEARNRRIETSCSERDDPYRN
ncbi:MAG: hypothetical protein ABIS03_03610 [Gemmatimonadaceae bacterium]